MKKYAGAFNLLAFTSVFFLTACSVEDVPSLIDALAQSVGGWVAFSAILGTIVEVLARLIPTAKPKSLIILVSKILYAVARLADAAARFLNGIVPQVLNDKEVEKIG